MSKVSIVIPVYNNWALTHQLLWSLYKKEIGNIDYILVVDDCSTDVEVPQGLKWWAGENLLPIFYISNPKNLGFLLSANIGLQTVTGFDDTKPEDIVILLSNDVQIRNKFITQITEIIVDVPKSLVGGVLYTHNTGWNTFDGYSYPYIEGWLLATTVENWAKLDYFDERFAPSDYEDIDLSTKAREIGMNLTPLNNPGLHHIGGQSIKYGEERLKQTNINKKKFEEKWTK